MEGSGLAMSVIGMGTTIYPLIDTEITKYAILEAICNDYHHFDTTFVYGSKQELGEAIAQALQLGLNKSRDEFFITSKLWCSFS